MRRLSKTRGASTIGVAETRWRRDQSSVAQNRVMAAKQAVCCQYRGDGSIRDPLHCHHPCLRDAAGHGAAITRLLATPTNSSASIALFLAMRQASRQDQEEGQGAKARLLSFSPIYTDNDAPYPREQGTIVVNNRIIAATVTYARSAPFDAMTFLYQAKLSLR